MALSSAEYQTLRDREYRIATEIDRDGIAVWTEDKRRENLSLEIERGDASLKAAETLASATLLDDAVSRAYCAAFHRLRALLVTAGLEPRTHSGTHDLFFQDFVATGLAPRELARLFSVLQKLREQSDYARAFRASEQDATEQLEATRHIRTWPEQYLRDNGWLA